MCEIIRRHRGLLASALVMLRRKLFRDHRLSGVVCGRPISVIGAMLFGGGRLADDAQTKALPVTTTKYRPRGLAR